MTIKVNCPNEECGKVLMIGEAHAGKTGKCPACGNLLQIPALEADSTDVEEAIQPARKPAKPATKGRPVAKAKALPPEPDEEDEALDELEEIEDDDLEEESGRSRKQPRKLTAKETKTREWNKKNIRKFGDWTKVREGIFYEMIGVIPFPIIWLIATVLGYIFVHFFRAFRLAEFVVTLLLFLSISNFIFCSTLSQIRYTTIPEKFHRKRYCKNTFIIWWIGVGVYVISVLIYLGLVSYNTIFPGKGRPDYGVAFIFSIISMKGWGFFLGIAMIRHLTFWLFLGIYFNFKKIRNLALSVLANNFASFIMLGVLFVTLFLASSNVQFVVGSLFIILCLVSIVGYVFLLLEVRSFLKSYVK